jgi:hypothetical protein
MLLSSKNPPQSGPAQPVEDDPDVESDLRSDPTPSPDPSPVPDPNVPSGPKGPEPLPGVIPPRPAAAKHGPHARRTMAPETARKALDVGLLGLLSTLSLALVATSCGATKSELALNDARSPHNQQPVAQETALDSGTPAREQLGLIRQELLRVSNRLAREGTTDQRAHWQGDLSDIEHDCTLLAAEWQDAERRPEAERVALRARLAPMIDVLYAVHARTAAEIDRSLDAAASN